MNNLIFPRWPRVENNAAAGIWLLETDQYLISVLRATTREQEATTATSSLLADHATDDLPRLGWYTLDKTSTIINIRQLCVVQLTCDGGDRKVWLSFVCYVKKYTSSDTDYDVHYSSDSLHPLPLLQILLSCGPQSWWLWNSFGCHNHIKGESSHCSFVCSSIYSFKGNIIYSSNIIESCLEASINAWSVINPVFVLTPASSPNNFICPAAQLQLHQWYECVALTRDWWAKVKLVFRVFQFKVNDTQTSAFIICYFCTFIQLC